MAPTSTLCAAVTTIFVIGTPIASAQTSTTDGVQALLRGDYQRAVRILQPLAERPTDPDPVAQFFFAALQESSRSSVPGGAPSQVRACALYVAAARSTNAFQSQSQALADAIRLEFGPMAEKLCTTDPVMLGDRGKIAPPSLAMPDRAALGPTIEASAAYLRGDYAAAAALLEPLASRAFSRDYSAEFLLASLYDTGLGVSRDWMKACALYLRSADGGPLQLQGRELWQAIQKRLTPDNFQECLRRSRIGFHDGFQPVTFTLASGQSVSWTLDGATITYLGRERAVKDDMFTLRGIRFLPVRYTPVDVGPRHATRRHFMDVLLWIPQGPRKWDLMWQLFEVVRDNLVEVTRERLSTALGDEPPDGVDDLDTLFRIEESDQGETLLIVLAGEHPRMEVIPTEAERAEARGRAAARNGPVNWKATKDIGRPPTFEYVPASGCGSGFVFAPSSDHMEAITVQMADDLLPPIATLRTYDVAGTSTRMGIQVHVFGRPVRMPYCTDVRVGPPPEEQTWRAVEGTITIERPRVHGSSRPRLTIRLEGAVFVSPSGVRVAHPAPIVLPAVMMPPAG